MLENVYLMMGMNFPFSDWLVLQEIPFDVVEIYSDEQFKLCIHAWAFKIANFYPSIEKGPVIEISLKFLTNSQQNNQKPDFKRSRKDCLICLLALLTCFSMGNRIFIEHFFSSIHLDSSCLSESFQLQQLKTPHEYMYIPIQICRYIDAVNIQQAII